MFETKISKIIDFFLAFEHFREFFSLMIFLLNWFRKWIMLIS